MPANLTPMMQQYLTLKEKYSDCLLFFRLGDFYEMFFEDALTAARELDIVLTGRDCGLEERAPMCGVPYHSVDTYISRLIEKGYKVAVCEQLTDPALAKGLVERDVVRVLRHPDGTRSFYKRQAGWKGMQCATYTASGKLAAINDYTEGRYGQLMGCVIYNNKREVIYKVSYGYDRKARLIEERMYSYPEQKLVQRVIYKYDARGKRSKPLIISLNPNAAAIAPTMDEDATRMHQELNRRGGRR